MWTQNANSLSKDSGSDREASADRLRVINKKQDNYTSTHYCGLLQCRRGRELVPSAVLLAEQPNRDLMSLNTIVLNYVTYIFLYFRCASEAEMGD